MALPTRPSISIRPLAEDSALTYYWYGSPASTFTLDVSGSDYASTFTFLNSGFKKVTGLTNGELYSANLINNSGSNSSLPASYRTVQPGNKPSFVQTVTASVVDGFAVISWTAPSTDGEATIGWYVITDLADPTGQTKYNTYGNLTTISIPYITGHYQYKIQAVNDPGYSAPVVVSLGAERGYSQIMMFTTASEPNYLYQVYNTTTKAYSPAIDSTLLKDDWNLFYDSPSGYDGYYTLGFSSVGSNVDGTGLDAVVRQFIGIEGVLRQSIKVYETDQGYASYNNTYATTQKSVWYALQQDLVDNTSTIWTMYSPSLDLLKQATVPLDLTHGYQQRVHRYPTGMFFFYYDNNTSDSTAWYWKDTWSAPSTIFTCRNHQFYWSAYNNLNSAKQVGIIEDDAGIFYTSTIYADGSNNLSLVALPENTYTGYSGQDYFGIQNSNYWWNFYNSNTDWQDIYTFINGSNTSPIVLSNVYASAIYYYDDNKDYQKTAQTNIFHVVDISGAGIVNYTLFEGASQFTSTLFDGTLISSFGDLNNYGMNRDAILRIGQTDSNDLYSYIMTSSNVTSTLLGPRTDFSATMTYNYIKPFDGHFAFTLMSNDDVTASIKIVNNQNIVKGTIVDAADSNTYRGDTNIRTSGSNLFYTFADSNLAVYVNETISSINSSFFSGDVTPVGTQATWDSNHPKEDQEQGLFLYSVGSNTTSTLMIKGNSMIVSTFTFSTSNYSFAANDIGNCLYQFSSDNTDGASTIRLAITTLDGHVNLFSNSSSEYADGFYINDVINTNSTIITRLHGPFPDSYLKYDIIFDRSDRSFTTTGVVDSNVSTIALGNYNWTNYYQSYSL